MKVCKIYFFFFFLFYGLSAQEISGYLCSEYTGKKLKGIVRIDSIFQKVDTTGFFNISVPSIYKSDTLQIQLSAKNHISIILDVIIDSTNIDLQKVYLRYISKKTTISLEEQKKNNKPLITIIPIINEGPRDIINRKATFSFSQAFYKRKGLKSQDVLLINGIFFNSISAYKPLWYLIGGLNAITNNQIYNSTTTTNPYHLGGLGTTTNIIIAPHKRAKGLRLTSSATNRGYNSRFMVTYNSGMIMSNKLAYTFSLSKRWLNYGYIEGASYRTHGIFGGLSYNLSKKWVVSGFGLFSPSSRSIIPALTKEVKSLNSERYNPYWGFQNGKVRNSRVKTSHIPVFNFIVYYNTSKFKSQFSWLHINGSNKKSRLSYNNAPNPDPTYYRKLPSYYTSLSDINIAKKLFIENNQINWPKLYETNINNKDKGASYILYADAEMTNDNRWLWNNRLDLLDKRHQLSTSIFLSTHRSNYFAEILDFLGAEFYENKDSFSKMSYDTNTSDKRKTKIGDKINYNYTINANELNGLFNYKFLTRNTDNYISLFYSYTTYQREGFFRHEAYPNSFGKSPLYTFNGTGLKLGNATAISPKYTIKANILLQENPINYRNLFFNARENNQILRNIYSQKIFYTDISLLHKSKILSTTLTVYHYLSKDATQVQYYYASSGIGANFFREIATGVDTKHMGIEFSSKIKIYSQLDFIMMATIGQYTYTNSPNILVNFNPSSINKTSQSTFKDLGNASLKNYYISNGPQNSFATELSYSSDKYWKFNISFNLLTHNYISISKISRTPSFYQNPEDTQDFPFVNISTRKTRALLKQERLADIFFIDLSFYKSWLVQRNYISLSVGINNLLDNKFFTGGYEQSRAANYKTLSEDTQKNVRTFGPKYWQNRGFTFFINLNFSI